MSFGRVKNNHAFARAIHVAYGIVLLIFFLIACCITVIFQILFQTPYKALDWPDLAAQSCARIFYLKKKTFSLSPYVCSRRCTSLQITQHSFVTNTMWTNHFSFLKLDFYK